MTITVGDVNRPPVLDPIGSKTINEGESLTFTVTATDPDNQVPSNPSISNLTVDSGKAYEIVQNGLTTGAVAYIDRDYTYSSFPTLLGGATYIKTASDDKASSGNSFISFSVDQDVTVYVAHDDRITSKPSWLIPFADIGQLSISTGATFSIFAKDFPAGTISLGGNESGSYNMYCIIIVGQMNAGGDNLTYSASNLPGGASLNSGSGVFSWTPDFGDAGDYDVVFTVTDNGSPVESDSETVPITVNGVSPSPSISLNRASLSNFCVEGTNASSQTFEVWN